MQHLISALKGCRDALDAIPEGIRGVHDHKINRALRRADAALKAIGVKMPTKNNLYALRDVFRSLTYAEMERFAHLLVSNGLPVNSDIDYEDVDTKAIAKCADDILLACDQIDIDEEEDTSADT